MNAVSYVLACSLLEGLPMPHRIAWASFLRRFEPHPKEVHEAGHILHLSGLLEHGRLTPEGVLAARLALHEALNPPPLNTRR